jgi:hypothetical protein
MDTFVNPQRRRALLVLLVTSAVVPCQCKKLRNSGRNLVLLPLRSNHAQAWPWPSRHRFHCSDTIILFATLLC